MWGEVLDVMHTGEGGEQCRWAVEETGIRFRRHVQA